ncbi:MAG: cell wall-binding protein [Eubacterium sp.]|nr:cell wall-binding protein [Eubacterium sp.]
MKLEKIFRTVVLFGALSFLLFGNVGKLGNVAAAGWIKSGNDWKYDDGNGPVKSRWMFLDGNWYYFGNNGNMFRGMHTIKGKSYYFCPGNHGSWSDGMMMSTCWQLVNGEYKYFNSDGVCDAGAVNVSSRLKGIDVSEFQGNMDWHQVKASGISFAFIRVGHGNHNIDPFFQSNMKNAKAAGIKTGVYFYSTAKSAFDSRLDAQWVIDQLRGLNVDYPVAIDMEEPSTTFLGKQTLTYIAKVFCDEIRAAGYTPIVYCNENWAINYLDLPSLNNVYTWVARYSGTYDSGIKRDVWQSNSRTILNGISANSVDLDFGFTDFSSIVTPRTAPKPGYTKNTTPVPSRTTYTASQTGWQLTGDKWTYINADGSVPRCKWQKIDGKWYYFNSSGYMKTGMIKLKGKRYILLASGARATNRWVVYKGKKYHADKNGVLAKGKTTIKGKVYYFNKNCIMKKGWVTLGKKKYYFGKKGAMFRNRLLKEDGKTYFFDKNGVMAKSKWVKIKDKYYYFNSRGNLAKNRKIGKYTVDKNGVRID